MPAEILHFWLSALVWIVGAGLVLTGLDDAFVDLAAHLRTLRRRLTVYRRSARAAATTLPRIAERPCAVLVPAWRESTVIAQMLQHLRRRFAYGAYTVFLGHYPNDPETARAARAVDPEGAWLRIVTLAHAGPTSKADCLNGLWRALQRQESAQGFRFAFAVLHDAEDLVHRDELTLLNYLSRRADMVQLPVVPLSRGLGDWIAGTYQDEFAESHQKELSLREGLAGGVPSAGVGCALTREALDRLAACNAGAPFAADSLTEDYAAALTLLAQGRRSIFVRLPETAAGTAAPGECAVATREYFPCRLRAAVRQKARWLIGIVLESWHRDGWPGGPGAKYMLLRDRKAIPTAVLGACACLVTGAILAYESARAAGGLSGPPLAPPGSGLAWLLLANALLLSNRLLHRVVYVWRAYGAAHGLLAILRVLPANVINCLAALRALRLYLGHRLTGRALAWDKTEHGFPSVTPTG